MTLEHVSLPMVLKLMVTVSADYNISSSTVSAVVSSCSQPGRHFSTPHIYIKFIYLC